jgi:hypothetical protein
MNVILLYIATGITKLIIIASIFIFFWEKDFSPS